MYRFCSSVLLAVLMVACSTMTAATPEEQVAQRAQARIDALRAGNAAESMEYTTPGYRQASSLGQYRANYAGIGNWAEATVDTVACEVDRCDVRNRVSYQLPRPRITNTRLLD